MAVCQATLLPIHTTTLGSGGVAIRWEARPRYLRSGQISQETITMNVARLNQCHTFTSLCDKDSCSYPEKGP